MVIKAWEEQIDTCIMSKDEDRSVRAVPTFVGGVAIGVYIHISTVEFVNTQNRRAATLF